MCFTIFQNVKTPFQAIKSRTSKSGKIVIFPKGLVNGFGQKLTIFPSFFFLAINARKMCFTIFQNEKNVFLSYKNKNLKKWKNCYFLKGVSPWFWSKRGHFSMFFFKGNIGQENVFYVILERKNLFLGYKNKKFGKWKNCHFSKVYGFVQKLAFFSSFSLKVVQARKMCFTIFQNVKTPFWAIKSRTSKSGKIVILVHAFGKKFTIFPSFFFLAIKARKMCFTISQNEKTCF